ncbi:hypothetical protein EYB53_024420 [Candidatus Chloroploca sp. M-50]|uniref:DUF3368 domain-containing protein n=1 Tax=Candidatus Chloroploca mongolica TaxID=2528176 RepID=A0ABS4DHI2_9CHLR|nr:hypothetical protein [Candidatus Chloroploca mongolica]MBP1468878.1 hypothetical protein [Candidatus Chloroploca mongolica]
MSIITNTTVLSNFARIGHLDLLRNLFGVLALPLEVLAEIQDAQAEGYTFFDGVEQVITPFAADGWLQLVSMTEAELQLFAMMPARLHRGERACLAIARQRSWLMLTDDRAARDEARRHAVALSGSLGCLVLSVERHHASLDQANRWLASMMAQGYRSPLTDLASLVKPGLPGDPQRG